MRRADRLFQIIQRLRRNRHPTIAAHLADVLGVSLRTVYRDIRDLVASGVPIRGEAGVGYVLSRSYDLPPLMFDEEEIEALVLGARVVRSWGDPALAAAADSVLSKVEGVLPEPLRDRVAGAALFALNRPRKADGEMLGQLRIAIRGRRRVRLVYGDRHEQETDRIVQPLGLFYWGLLWTLGAYCELRQGFRTFRIDRIQRASLLDDSFPTVPGRTLADLFAHYAIEAEAEDAERARAAAHGDASIA